jgi:glycerol-3-phosphate dehydrogenase
VDYLLDHANALLRTPLTHEDVVGVYAGLRPLLSGESDDTSRLSREHAVVSPVAGLVMVAGGKYTTYRVMARDAVDAVAHGFPRKVPPSCTESIPLVGAEGFRAAWNRREQLAAESGLHLARIEHLLRRYGSLVGELLDLVRDRPDLAEPLPGAPTYLRVEAWYAAQAEGALHLDDILTRRTRISIESADRGLAAAAEVAPLVAPVLGWSGEEAANEVEHYRARVAAEIDSQEQPDDRTADAARLGAADVRAGAPA